MQFAEIVGQKRIKEQLTSMEGRVSHAILFSEESGYGALAMAIAFAQYLSCPSSSAGDSCGVCSVCNRFSKLIHPDLHFAMPVNTTKTVTADKKPVSDHFIAQWRESVLSDPYITEQQWYDKIEVENKSGMIGVNEATLIVRKLSLRAFEGGRKFMIIWLPERMNQEAANRLLKLIEEPPQETFIFLVSESPERIITTILSRCQIFSLPPVDKDDLGRELMQEFDIDQTEAHFWARISGGSISRARQLIRDSEMSTNYDKSLTSLLEACASKDLKGVITFWEEISLIGRENQKRFCEYTLEFLRRALITKMGACEISNTPISHQKQTDYWSGRINPSFYPKAYELLNNALHDINRNVNPRYIFADLGNRFFLSL
ncbi:MAG: hypothetical protein Q8R90_12015 [Bacteroidales bacterium]|nr:hypothetical protein [Bacteroidales bacterium]